MAYSKVEIAEFIHDEIERLTLLSSARPKRRFIYEADDEQDMEAIAPYLFNDQKIPS